MLFIIIRLYSGFYKACDLPNGPYSLLVRASYFIYYSVYARSTSVILSFANGAGGVGVF